MAFWHRIGSAGIERLPRQFRRWYSLLPGAAAPAGRAAGGWRESGVLEEHGHYRPSPCRSTGVRFMAVRFFAAPVQVKPRQEMKDPNGPRLNQAITAAFIRLVTDDGHGIVSRQEALDRARKLNLDLVEVQRTAKPPVCKIMDYHRERYKKETTEKERSKSKSGVTVRKGDFKEVRLQGKIEKKDIEMKAQMVKGLMERGYRVKCMAIPPKKKKRDSTEEHDLAGLLSRLSALIEDVSIVESGPFVEREQAYVIVRHVKFGHSKKGSGKSATKNSETTRDKVQRDSLSMPTSSCAKQEQDTEEPESCVETEDEVFSDQEADTQHSVDAPHATPDSSEEMPWSGVDVTDDFDKIFSADAGINVTNSSITGNSVSVGTLSSSDDTFGPKLHQKLAVASGATGSAFIERSPAYKPVQGSAKPIQETKKDKVDRHFPPVPLSGQSEPLPVDSNRYSRRNEMNGRFQETRSPERRSRFTETNVTYQGSESFAIQRNQLSRGPVTAYSQEAEQQRSDKTWVPRQPPSNVTYQGSESFAIQRNQLSRGPVTAYSQGAEQQGSDKTWVPRQPPSSGIREREQLDPKQRQTSPVDNRSPAPGYGIFSTPKTAAPDDERNLADMNRVKRKAL